ncbi:hypothetical protein P261_02833 [Lachnospiraceae bacterium TWA4]|nr:hypothetical protein P261_02833 [Lachnospiraceae bacterium TWA4]
MFNQWVKTLVIFMILVPLVNHMLIEKNYQSYVSYYLGLLFILVLVSPMSQLLDLDKIIEFEPKIESQVVGDLQIKNSLSEWTSNQIEEYVKQLAKNNHLKVKKCKSLIDEKIASQTYGQVICLEVWIEKGGDTKRLKQQLFKTFGGEIKIYG